MSTRDFFEPMRIEIHGPSSGGGGKSSVEGFRAALRNQLGTVKQIRQQKMTEPSRHDEPKRMSAFIYPAHRGEG